MPSDDYKSRSNASKPVKPTPSQHSARGKSGDTLQIGNVTYDVLERLSLPSRGRWKVRDRRPHPKGTLYTVIDVEETAESIQLKGCLAKLTKDCSGIPSLKDFQRKDGRLQMLVSWSHGTDLDMYFKRVVNGKSLPPSVWESIRRIRSLSHLTGILHRNCRIVHGDIKPANLVLPSEPGSIAIIDFGSSWQIERTRGREIGDGSDQHYSAPEVF